MTLHTHFSFSTKRFICLLLIPNFICFVPHTFLLYFLVHIGNWKSFFHQATGYMSFYHPLQTVFENDFKKLVYKLQYKDKSLSLTKTDLNVKASLCLPSGPLNSGLIHQSLTSEVTVSSSGFIVYILHLWLAVDPHWQLLANIYSKLTYDLYVISLYFTIYYISLYFKSYEVRFDISDIKHDWIIITDVQTWCWMHVKANQFWKLQGKGTF